MPQTLISEEGNNVPAPSQSYMYNMYNRVQYSNIACYEAAVLEAKEQPAKTLPIMPQLGLGILTSKYTSIPTLQAVLIVSILSKCVILSITAIQQSQVIVKKQYTISIGLSCRDISGS